MALYREYKGIDIAVHAHQSVRRRWVPTVLLMEPTVGSTKTLTLVAPLVDGFDSEDDALMAGMRYALDSLGG